jgi:hypothetical protein
MPRSPFGLSATQCLIRGTAMRETITFHRRDRVAIAEAQRFPDLASSVHLMARERGVEAVARLLADAAKSDELGTLPAFALERNNKRNSTRTYRFGERKKRAALAGSGSDGTRLYGTRGSSRDSLIASARPRMTSWS